MKMKLVFLLVIFLASATTLSGQISVPNSFSSGGTISAAEMNANFTALVMAFNELRDDLEDAEATISTLSQSLSDAEDSIGELESTVDNPVRVYANRGASYQALPTSTWTTVVFATEVIDSHNAYSPANGGFTVPESGTYLVGFNLSYQFDTGGDALAASVGIFVNTLSVTNSYANRNSGSDYANAVQSQILSLSAGDLVDIRTHAFNIGDVSIISGVNSTFSIMKID